MNGLYLKHFGSDEHAAVNKCTWFWTATQQPENFTVFPHYWMLVGLCFSRNLWKTVFLGWIWWQKCNSFVGGHISLICCFCTKMTSWSCFVRLSLSLSCVYLWACRHSSFAPFSKTAKTHFQSLPWNGHYCWLLALLYFICETNLWKKEIFSQMRNYGCVFGEDSQFFWCFISGIHSRLAVM